MATFFNQATLSYSGGTVNSNITTGEIVEVLSVTKTAVKSVYSQDDEITYAVNIINSGNTAFSGLTVTDNLGSYTYGTTTLVPLQYVANTLKYFVNGVLQTTPTVTSNSPLTVSGITVPENSTATLLYTVKTNNFASPVANGTVTNTVTVNGTALSELTASATITASNEPILSITKSLSPTTVNENSQITYTFNIQNTGNTAAETSDNIVITDTFDPILKNITVTYNGTVWTQGVNYTYDETTGVFTTVAGSVTVPAATFTQDETTGAWAVNSASSALTISGTL